MVVETGVVRHGRGRNVPSAIAGQLETLGGCAGSGVQNSQGMRLISGEVERRTPRSTKQKRERRQLLLPSGNGYRAGVKPCHFPPFLRVPGKAGAPAILPIRADTNVKTPMGNHAAALVLEEKLSPPSSHCLTMGSIPFPRLRRPHSLAAPQRYGPAIQVRQ